MLASTSGSTGTAKWFAISHRNMADRIEKRIKAFGITDGDVFLRLPSITYLGSKFRHLTQLAGGGASVINDFRDLEPVELINKFSVTFLSGVVIQVERLVASPTKTLTQILPNIRVIELSASLIGAHTRHLVRTKLNPNIYITYSSNEFGTSNVAFPDDVANVPYSVGRTLAGIELEIVDKQNMALSEGQMGLIRLRSSCMIEGYLGASEDEKFRGGWYYPGDLGKIDKNGQLLHFGRADNLMIWDGVNIYPAEIENCLHSHPQVADVYALPVKHQTRQHIPVCLVELEPGARVGELELGEFVKSKLGNRTPARIFIFDRLPRNLLGKINIQQVNEMLERQSKRQSKEATNSKIIPIDNQHDGSRPQPKMTLRVSFRPQQAASLTRIEEWLTAIVPEYSKLKPRPNQGHRFGDPGSELWLWCSLLLSRWLLQSARVPVFDMPEIVELKKSATSEEEYIATVQLSDFGGISRNIYMEVLKVSNFALDWFATRKLTEENRSSIITYLDKQFVSKTARIVGGGKSTFHVLKTAYDLGIPFRQIGGGIYRLGWGSRSILLDRSTTEYDSAMGARVTNNKALTARILRGHGLPGPFHALVVTGEMAVKQASKIGWPIVIKPVDSDRGEGITVDINDESQLLTAFDTAQKRSKLKQVLVEKQLKGVCHRLFVVNGKLLYAVKRMPMSVQGDGKTSVAQLITHEVKRQAALPPWDRSEIKPLDDLARESIARAGYELSSIPQKEDLVPLRRIESTEWGGVDEDVTECIHPDNIDIAVRATGAFGLNVAGIDIISEDIRKPWYQNGAIINEVNFSPLLGGGDISKGKIARYLREYIPGDGTIPIILYVGGDQAWQRAEQDSALLSESETHGTYITNGLHTIDLGNSSKKVVFNANGLVETVAALMNDKTATRILVVVQTDEFLHRMPPMGFCESCYIIDNEINAIKRQGQLSSERFDQLVSYCRSLILHSVS